MPHNYASNPLNIFCFHQCHVVFLCYYFAWYVCRSHFDGRIHVWNYTRKVKTLTFNGHKGAVTALAFNDDGTQLASGARDTDIVVWDTVADTGLFR